MKRLINETSEGRPLVLIVGAGISISTGIPTGGDLRKQMIAELKHRGHHGLDQKSYSELMALRFPTSAERRAFFENLCLGKSPSDEHHLIAELVRAGHVKAVITTNFDHLLEHGFLNVCGRVPPTLLLGSLNQQLFSNISQPVLAKVHGDFLYENIVNLPSEIRGQITGYESDLIRELCCESNMLVVGYGGLDENIMANLTATLTERGQNRAKIWWSEYSRDPLVQVSEFSKLVTSAERARNPITRLGPWSASDCLKTLADGLGIHYKIRFPYGISCDLGIFEEPHVHSFQEYAGQLNERIAALNWFTPKLSNDSITVLRISPEYSYLLSIVLSAVAESKAPGSLYFDPKFAPGPPHISLRDSIGHHVKLNSALTLNRPISFDDFCHRNSVLVIDRLERQNPTDVESESIDSNLLHLINKHIDCQAAVGKGSVVIGTSLTVEKLDYYGLFDGAEIIDLDNELDGLSDIYLQSLGLSNTDSARKNATNAFLETLSVSKRALPLDIALKVSGCAESILNEPETALSIDRRGKEVMIRPELRNGIATTISPPKVQEIAKGLSEELLKLAHSSPFMVDGSRILSAETLLFSTEADPILSLELFTSVKTEFNRDLDYIRDTVLDYAKLMLASPNDWTNTPISTAMAFINYFAALTRLQLQTEDRFQPLGSREISKDYCWQIGKLVQILAGNRPSEVHEQFELEIYEEYGSWLSSEPSVFEANALAKIKNRYTEHHDETRLRRWLHSQILIHRRALRNFHDDSEDSIEFLAYTSQKIAGLYRSYLGLVCFNLGFVLDKYPAPNVVEPIIKKILTWNQRRIAILEPHKLEEKLKNRYGQALDDQFFPLKFLRPPNEITDTLLDRVREAAADKGFTARKAVNYGNYALHLLERGEISAAVPWIHESNLNGMMIGDTSIIPMNLEALKREAGEFLPNIKSGPDSMD